MTPSGTRSPSSGCRSSGSNRAAIGWKTCSGTPHPAPTAWRLATSCRWPVRSAVQSRVRPHDRERRHRPSGPGGRNRLDLRHRLPQVRRSSPRPRACDPIPVPALAQVVLRYRAWRAGQDRADRPRVPRLDPGHRDHRGAGALPTVPRWGRARRGAADPLRDLREHHRDLPGPVLRRAGAGPLRPRPTAQAAVAVLLEGVAPRGLRPRPNGRLRRGALPAPAAAVHAPVPRPGPARDRRAPGRDRRPARARRSRPAVRDHGVPARWPGDGDLGVHAPAGIRGRGDHRGLHHPGHRRQHHRSDRRDRHRELAGPPQPDIGPRGHQRLPVRRATEFAVRGCHRRDSRLGVSGGCRGRHRRLDRAHAAPLPEDHRVTATPSSVVAPTATIVLEHASRWYGNVVAVNDVSFTIGPGITSLLGPNGAGKTTILHMLAGLLRPSSGRVLLGGQPAWRNPGVYRSVGLVPEREAVYDFLTGREFVEMCGTLHRLPDPAGAATRAIATVDLEGAAARPVGTYSKGMRQRVKIAGALVHEPSILLLDEPFNGMDPRQRLHMIELLRSMAAEGRAILFSSHILEEVERLAEQVLVINAGRLAASGNYRQIRRLMTDRPHTFVVRSSDNRRLAAAFLGKDAVFGAELHDGRLTVRVAEFSGFTRIVAQVARDAGVSLFEVAPTDDSLESVFAYLTSRR